MPPFCTHPPPSPGRGEGLFHRPPRGAFRPRLVAPPPAQPNPKNTPARQPLLPFYPLRYLSTQLSPHVGAKIPPGHCRCCRKGEGRVWNREGSPPRAPSRARSLRGAGTPPLEHHGARPAPAGGVTTKPPPGGGDGGGHGGESPCPRHASATRGKARTATAQGNTAPAGSSDHPRPSGGACGWFRLSVSGSLEGCELGRLATFGGA